MAKEFIVYSATRASFEAQVASGEVDNTQIGIIAESGEFWENGNYHPLVMLTDYLKKTDAVALAKDLTGSIEATPEEFIFRTSAGTKSIRDESAVIRRIKGNTSVWGQKLQSIPTRKDFEGVTTFYDSSTNECVIQNISRTTPYASGSLRYEIKPNLYPIVGHKYAIFSDRYYKGVGVAQLGGVFREVNTIFEADSSSLVYFRLNFTFDFINTCPVGSEVRLKINIVDLTELYGKGNEPTTIEEFKKLYPESYYPYCEPEVRSMRATGIETIGANAFDKDSVVGGKLNADGSVTSNDIYSVAKIEVVPYEKYTLTNVANAYNSGFTYALYDSNDKFLSIGQLKYNSATVVTRTGDVTMPLNARYMRVVVHNDYLDSCCVNLKHSGTLTAEEAVYFKEVRMLPDIAKYFPDGMHGIGDVFDEINEEIAVKRFGVVDLGTLTWRYDATYNTFYASERIFAYRGKAKCTRYELNNVHPPQKLDKQMSLASYYYLNTISIKDFDYTDSTSFKAAMSGVMLVYELIEPIVTPITEPLQLDYKVADFGTEKMLSDFPSSPFRADIVYQFNAADRIRDNARNIERLEEQTKNMATMDYVIEKIPTTIATATERVTTWPSDNRLVANVLVDVSSESQGTAAYSILGFVGGSSDYLFDDVWRIRFAGFSSALNILPEIYWVNGEAPSFDTWAICDIEFRRTPLEDIIGEWKIYR